LEVCWGEQVGVWGGEIFASEGDEFGEFVGLWCGKVWCCFLLLRKWRVAGVRKMGECPAGGRQKVSKAMQKRLYFSVFWLFLACI
jgi:hypothetical protein